MKDHVVQLLRTCAKEIKDDNPHAHLAYLNIKGAIFELEYHAAELAGRDTFFSIDQAVSGKVCVFCNHIICKGECHAENRTSRSSNLRQGTRTRNKLGETR